jgi:hypothetical protein
MTRVAGNANPHANPVMAGRNTIIPASPNCRRLPSSQQTDRALPHRYPMMNSAAEFRPPPPMLVAT